MISLCRPAGHCRPTVLVLALLAAFAPPLVHADSVAESSVSAGLGFVGGNRSDRAQFDQYSGLRPSQNVFGIFGADYYRRNDDTGVAVGFTVNDLFTHNRELGLGWGRQGDWRASVSYGELQRRETVLFKSGIVNIGSTTPAIVPVAPGTGFDQDLSTLRSGLGVGFSKVISPRVQFDVSARTEHKDGTRLFGVGFACPSAVAPNCTGTNGVQVGSAVLFVPEPIDADHHQLEARASFAGEQTRFSVGYYGSFYQNGNASLTPQVPGSLFNPAGVLLPVSPGLAGILGNPVALPPDNQAHTLDVTGVYLYSPTTQLNFKVARSRAMQNDNFLGNGLTGAPGGVASLNGRVDTTLAQAGFSSRPMPKLAVYGSVRYEDRDDNTPIASYNVEGTNTFTNRRLPWRSTRAKLEGNYQLSPVWRAGLGANWEEIDRGVFTPSSATSGVTALRQKTDETAFTAELRRRMGEDVSGAVRLVHSDRSGSNWLRDNSGLGVTEVPDANAAGTGFDRGIFMPTLADRRRDKVRLLADWQPSEELAVQAALDAGRDEFSAPGVYGVRSSGLNQFTLDGTYAINSKWGVNSFLSVGRQQINQGKPDAAFMAFRNHETSFGLGVKGKPTSALELGANLSYLQDRSTYAQTLDATASPADAALLGATGGLPPITFRQHILRLTSRYTLDKKSSIRAEFEHWRTSWDDWAWGHNGTPFVYSDGTIGTRETVQRVNVVRVVYTYLWQ